MKYNNKRLCVCALGTKKNIIKKKENFVSLCHLYSDINKRQRTRRRRAECASCHHGTNEAYRINDADRL